MTRTLRLVRRRLVGSVFVLLIVVVGSFLMLQAAPGDAVDGQLLAHWGPLAVGVGLRNGRREFHLLRPAHWYEAQRLP